MLVTLISTLIALYILGKLLNLLAYVVDSLVNRIKGNKPQKAQYIVINGKKHKVIKRTIYTYTQE